MQKVSWQGDETISSYVYSKIIHVLEMNEQSDRGLFQTRTIGWYKLINTILIFFLLSYIF
jgi:hypothetical protein